MIEPASVGPWVRPSTLSNIDISETSGPIAIKFNLKHYCVGGKTALGFGPHRIRTVLSMTKDISHRDILAKCFAHFSAFIFN